MDTFVLIPEEFSLEHVSSGIVGVISHSPTTLPVGLRFSPFQGTLRTETNSHFPSWPSGGIGGGSLRATIWTRFLREFNQSPLRNASSEVNLVELVTPTGQLVYEVCRPIKFREELTVLSHPLPGDIKISGNSRRRETPLGLMSRLVKEAIFDETLRRILRDVPLDLSMSLFFCPVTSSTPASTSSSSVQPSPSQQTSTTGMSPNGYDLDLDLEDAQNPNASFEPNSTASSPDNIRHLQNSTNTQSWGQASLDLSSRPRVDKKKRTSRTLLPCAVCSKGFDRPSLLKRHMRTHTGEKPHGCDVCGKGFSTSSSLNTHRRIHSGEKPHECPVCGKRFTASSNLYYHRMTHVKEKPHKCGDCGKSFPTPGDLKSHVYVHTGSWPFRCPVCRRGFSKHTNLKNHLFLHTGTKPHVCGLCPKRFALACNLRAHLKTHEEENENEAAKGPSSTHPALMIPRDSFEDEEDEEELSESESKQTLTTFN